MNIVTCFKWVKDEADIKVAANSNELVFDRVGYKISDYDRSAIEEAVRLKEEHGGSVVAVTVGEPSATQSLKDALSRGPEKACFINDPSFINLEPSQTMAILADTIGKMEYDLIICGEGSSDLYAQQVGPGLAEKLDIPCATNVNKLTYVEEDKTIIAERKLEDGVEVVAIPLPALVTVLPDINTPRIPTLKQVLGAAKKPVEKVTLNELGQQYEPRLREISVFGATMERRRLRFGAEPVDIKAVIDALLKEGIIA
ncbi:Electron transfer flavoprotein subunit beta [Pelotomaculum sp. FP]|uniref:electron transfer flavoprotein subunit beta/FixA family protein n=1 Tax=Pelotomaculum sp. FP TaxID=261474 RepID=UPI0010669CB4|nr:electron transfer flavoprotein subunit beta/FixA family protein [Pelotomaculum sp. FP]TEB13873.1 Electron transfer flavoprotein subunit beta [Pelotomaculum sp. FP]